MRSPARFGGLAADSRGSVAVEFALFLPMLLTIIFAIVELGGAWYSQQMLVNAAREGARLGVAHQTEGVTTQQVVTLVTNNLTTSGFPGAVTVTATNVESGTGAQVRVTVTSPYQFPVLGNLVPGLTGLITLQADSVMRHE